jgi:prefoldin alpha subunit
MSLGGGGGNPQMQEIAAQIEELEKQQEAIEEEIESLQAEKRDIDEAISAIEGLESGATVQVPLGGGAYVRATIEDIDEVIVDLGADYSAEREQDGAIDSLETKQDTLDDRIEELRSEIAEIESESEQLEQRAEQMQAQQLQQMQQQQEQDE